MIDQCIVYKDPDEGKIAENSELQKEREVLQLRQSSPQNPMFLGMNVQAYSINASHRVFTTSNPS